MPIVHYRTLMNIYLLNSCMAYYLKSTGQPPLMLLSCQFQDTMENIKWCYTLQYLKISSCARSTATIQSMKLLYESYAIKVKLYTCFHLDLFSCFLYATCLECFRDFTFNAQVFYYSARAQCMHSSYKIAIMYEKYRVLPYNCKWSKMAKESKSTISKKFDVTIQYI